MHEFISYSSVDGKDFAFKLCEELESCTPPIRVWIDKRNLLPGQDWDKQIAEEIASCNSLLFVMTHDSVEDLSICKLEWMYALRYKKPVVPLLVHANLAIPFRLANRQYIDFTTDFTSVIEKLRSYLVFLRSPAGILLSLQERLTDARRDLRRTDQKDLLPRIEDEITQLELDIHKLQAIIDNPAAAVYRAEESISHGLEQERLADKRATSLANKRFINPPPGTSPSYFQNRYEETRIIGQFLRSDSLRLLTIIGRSGIGKTALVCRVLKLLEKDLLPDDNGALRVDGIIYLSSIGSRRVSMPNIWSDLSLLLAPSSFQEVQDLLKNAKSSVEEKMHGLLAHFTTKNVILLLDNLEDLIDIKGEIIDSELDRGLHSFLNFSHQGVKIIITSRITPKNIILTQPGRQKIIRLDEGLESPFAENLLREMDEDGRIGLKYAPAEALSKAREYTRGYPRALEALFAVLAADRDTSLEDILEIAEKQLPDNVVEALVGEAFHRLDAHSQKVIQALAIYHFPITATAVSYLLNPYFPGMDYAIILNRLVNMYFVRKERGQYHLHPIDRTYAIGSIPRGNRSDIEITDTLPFTQFALLHRAAEYFKQIRKPREEWKSIEDLTPQISEFELLCEGEEYDAAAQLLDEIDLDYLLLWSYANHVRSMREKLEGKIHLDSLRVTQTKSLGTLYAILGNLDKAIKYYQEMLKVLEIVEDKQSEIYALNNIANAYRRLVRSPEAIEYSQRALAIARQIPDLHSEGDIQVNLGNIYWTLGRYDEALEQLQKALSILQLTYNQRGEGYAFGGLGSTCLSLARLDEAIDYYQRALTIFRAISHRQGEAYILESLGRAYLHAGELEQAISYSVQSITIHNDISNVRGEGHSAFNLARIYRAKEDLTKALEYAEQASDSLARSRVPEATTAQAFVNVIKASMAADRAEEVRALLECANSPPSSGDLEEPQEFLREARAIAQRESLVNLEAEIQELIERSVRKRAL